MVKPKLNQQQQRRIAQKQSAILATEELSGLVVAHHGQNIEVEDTTGSVVICKKRQHLGPIVPGDRVKWQLDANTNSGVVTAIEPRQSLISRPDARGNLHATAANVQQMFIIIAPKPAPNLSTVDRYLIVAQQQNIEPILVLNKEDLLAQDPVQQQQLLDMLQVYKHIGVQTIKVSALKLQHLSALHAKMADKTSVFVGQSGVGKSSLINTLLPNIVIKTGALSTLNPHGKHTTTTARLYHVPGLEASIIDSPGMREIPLWKLDPATLAQGFVEFAPFLHACKFRNCVHLKEPGCALLNAVEAGKIAPMRMASYQKILESMQHPKH